MSGQEVIPNKLGLPEVDFNRSYRFFHAFHELVRAGALESAHDVGDGGWLATTAELLMGSGLGARIECGLGDFRTGEPAWAALFGEPATSFVLLVRDECLETVRERFSEFTMLELGETMKE